MSIYDDPDMRTGDFVSWRDIGDSLVGDVIEARKGLDFNGRPCPEIVVRTDDGLDAVMTCGQANLKAQPEYYENEVVKCGRFTGSRQTLAYVNDVIGRYDKYCRVAVR